MVCPYTAVNRVLDCVWNVMAHTQKPDFVFRRKGLVHLNRRGRQFSRLLAAEVCASAVVMLGTPCSEVVWRVLATHSIRQFPIHFPSLASPSAITFQLDSTLKMQSIMCAVRIFVTCLLCTGQCDVPVEAVMQPSLCLIITTCCKKHRLRLSVDRCVHVLAGRQVGQVYAHFPRPWAIHLVDSDVNVLPTFCWQSPHHYQALPVKNEIMEFEGWNLLRAKSGFALSMALWHT
jgi:hypothetical protein